MFHFLSRINNQLKTVPIEQMQSSVQFIIKHIMKNMFYDNDNNSEKRTLAEF
jgi:hypothetical protein